MSYLFSCAILSQDRRIRAWNQGHCLHCTSQVGIGRCDEGGFCLEVALEVHLEDLTKEEAEAIAAKAHATVCPYSNAVWANVPTSPYVVRY